MKNNIGKYELIVVIKPMLPDAVRTAVEEKITQLIAEGGGELVSADTLGKRYLAYKINGHTEGYYLLYNLTMPASHAQTLSTSLRLMSQILRYLILKK